MAKDTSRGVKWLSAAKVTLALVSLANVSVLVRYLDRDDFGLMAIANLVIGVVGLFLDMGITSAILHKQSITKEEYGSLYWLNMMFSVVLYGLVFIAAYPVATFYEDVRIVRLVQWIGLSIILSSIGRQYRIIFQKREAYERIAVMDIVGTTVQFCVGVGTAMTGWGVYSLVAATLARSTVVSLGYFVQGYRRFGLRFRFVWSEVTSFLRIGLWQVLSDIINYLTRELDIILIGKFLGTDLLGVYSLLKQLVRKPVIIIMSVISTITTPMLAKLQADVSQMRYKFYLLLNRTLTLFYLIYLPLALLAYPVLQVVYGEKIAGFYGVFQAMCLYTVLRAHGSPVGGLIVASGKTELNFYWNIIVSIILPAAIYFGSQFDLATLVLIMCTAMIVLIPLHWYITVRKVLGGNFFTFAKAYLPRKDFLVFLKQSLKIG